MRQITFLLAILIAIPLVSAQRRTSATVRTEKQETARKIENTRRQLDDNAARTSEELKNLQSIEGNMRRKQKEAGELRGSAENLRHESATLADSIKENTRLLKSLRQSYAATLRTIRNQRHLSSDAAYIFASGSFAKARSRIRYLSELAMMQKEKARHLKATTERLRRQNKELDSLQSALAADIDSIASIERTLLEQKRKANAVVGSLRRQGKNLDRVLREQERLARKLDDELNRIIEEEARKTKPQDKQRKGGDAKLSGSFAANKGKLPLPIDRDATIVSDFGRHTHSELERVQMQNNGVDFETTRGAQACAVFPGTVSMVIVMDGFDNVVLIRHGEYLTVYAGIDGLKVRKGQKVEAGQSLGAVTSDASGRTRLHFEVCHEKDKLNPADWLRDQ